MSIQKSIRLFLATLIAVLSLSVFAASVHYKKGPTCSVVGLTVTCFGSLSGVGNGAVTATLDFPQATATTICTSPGGNESPGQNPAFPVNASGSVTLPPADKNGNLQFSVTTNSPTQPTAEQAQCPNNNWTARIDTINFGRGTLTFVQNGQVVLSSSVTVTP